MLVNLRRLMVPIAVLTFLFVLNIPVVYAYFSDTASSACMTFNIYEPVEKYNLVLEVYPEGSGEVEGSGKYQAGAEATISAESMEGYWFLNWTEGDEIISTEEEYIYTMPARDVTLTANFITDISPEESDINRRPGQNTIQLKLMDQRGIHIPGEQLNIDKGEEVDERYPYIYWELFLGDDEEQVDIDNIIVGEEVSGKWDIDIVVLKDDYDIKGDTPILLKYYGFDEDNPLKASW